MSALEGLLDYYRDTAKNERDKGDKFERLTKFFLENDKLGFLKIGVVTNYSKKSIQKMGSKISCR